MPITPVAAPQYPNVPQSSGVPAVFRSPTAPVFTALLLTADVATVLRLFQGPQWGIFTAGGGPVAIPDTVVNVDFRRESRISDYPVEQGGFETYDKVEMPYDARVRLSCDGSTTPKGLFLSQIDNAYRSLDKFTVATPDAVYPNANIVHYDYRRARDEGAGVIQVDVWLMEVRENVTTQFTNTAQPQSASSVNGGTVQATQPTPAQAATLPVPPIPPAGGGNLLTVGPDTAGSVQGLA